MDQPEQRLFGELESNLLSVVDSAKNKFKEYFNSNKDPWLVNGLVDYFLASSSIRAVDVLVTIREPHDKHFFDKISENLKSSSNRLSALTLLGHIVQRQPTWLYKIVKHATLKELIRILKQETDMVELISALLVLNVLLPIIPGLLVGPYLNEIFDVFSRLASWNSDNLNRATSHLLHLQVALYALFYQLYGMFPCTFVQYLKQEYYTKCDVNTRNVFNHTVKPMIETVRLHPFLIISSVEEETSTERWKKTEHHDVVFNCTRFLLDASERPCRDDIPSLITSQPSIDISSTLDNTRCSDSNCSKLCTKPYCLHCGNQPVKFSLGAHLDSEIYSTNTTPAPMGTESTPTSIPHTPKLLLYRSSYGHAGTSPPEAAIEATPETTPVKDLRPVQRTNLGPSSAVRALCAWSPNDPFIKKQADLPTPNSPMKIKDVFNFPSASGNASDISKGSRLKDERIVAKEAFVLGNERTSNPSSPLTLLPPQETAEESEEAFSAQSFDGLSNSGFLSKHKTDLDTDLFLADDCSQESGSPCSRGGLHMPDSGSMMKLTRHHIRRQRYPTESTIPTSQSLGLSIGCGARDEFSYSAESKVRRTNSCPEMKKSSGGSLSGSFGSNPLKKLSEEEENKYGQIVPRVCSMEDHSTQTVDVPPNMAPYEHLFLGLFPSMLSYHSHSSAVHSNISSVHTLSTTTTTSTEMTYYTGHSTETCCTRKSNDTKYSEIIDRLIENVITKPKCNNKTNNTDCELRYYKEQLILINLQLSFERHRREVHSERNRRLLGKSRNIRALEEHNSALRDQVNLLQKDIERYADELKLCQNECKNLSERLEENIKHLKKENFSLHNSNVRLKTKCESLEQDAKAEKESRKMLNQILHETKSKLFDSNTEMENYKQAVTENKRLNSEVTYMQKEIIILGEMNGKFKDILSYLAELKNEYLYSELFHKAYSNQIENLEKLYKHQRSLLSSLKNQKIRLEEIIQDKEVTIQQFKCLFSSFKHQFIEQLEDMTSRYNSIQSSIDRQRTVELEHLYQIDTTKKKLGKYVQKYPNLDKSVTTSIGPIPTSATTSRNLNNTRNLQSLGISVHRETEKMESRESRNNESDRK